mmetsp:Transcript_10962/g.13592  ORF Transcript_10962/g.13592 Transcript_10962/m.13592 type:complete len:85 (+) Transcript_10962:856-1110(+)
MALLFLAVESKDDVRDIRRHTGFDVRDGKPSHGKCSSCSSKSRKRFFCNLDEVQKLSSLLKEADGDERLMFITEISSGVVAREG